MRTQNIVYSVTAPGTPEVYTGTLGTITIQTTNHNLSTSTGQIRIWPNGAAPTAAPSINPSGGAYVQGSTGGAIIVNLDNLETALSAVSSTETVWHYSLHMNHSSNQVHVCSGYLVRIIN